MVSLSPPFPPLPLSLSPSLSLSLTDSYTHKFRWRTEIKQTWSHVGGHWLNSLGGYWTIPPTLTPLPSPRQQTVPTSLLTAWFTTPTPSSSWGDLWQWVLLAFNQRQLQAHPSPRQLYSSIWHDNVLHYHHYYFFFFPPEILPSYSVLWCTIVGMAIKLSVW